jgi:putative membrane protein
MFLFHRRFVSGVTTLVVCIDRGGIFPPDTSLPVTGYDAVEALVTEVGLADPEDSRVNTMLEGLRVATDLGADGDDAIVTVVGDRGDGVSADRSVARQADELVEAYDPDSAVVVVDSAEDERLVPIIESRLRVDAVDRVVVRQARDIESTYYLLKQFLADEELRKTVLVPLGIALIAFPLLLLVTSTAFAVGAIAAAVGAFLIYKGMGIDEYLSRLPGEIQAALYSGQVSLVTYVVAGGLSLVGVFVGALGVRATGDQSVFIHAMRFAYDGVPWFTAAALAAATGRLIDELMQEETIRSAYVNLPFGAIAVGLVIRGFSEYFLERAGAIDQFRLGPTTIGPVTIDAVSLESGPRLALFILGGILVSLIGVRFAAYFSQSSVQEEFVE